MLPQAPPPNEDPMEQFSLEKRIPQVPLNSASPHPIIFWFRVFLKLAPGPLWYLLCAGLAWLGLMHFIVAIFSAAICAFGVGYCDAFLCESIRKVDGTPILKEALWHAFFFSLGQIIYAPLSIAFFFFLLITLYN